MVKNLLKPQPLCMKRNNFSRFIPLIVICLRGLPEYHAFPVYMHRNICFMRRSVSSTCYTTRCQRGQFSWCSKVRCFEYVLTMRHILLCKCAATCVRNPRTVQAYLRAVHGYVLLSQNKQTDILTIIWPSERYCFPSLAYFLLANACPITFLAIWNCSKRITPFAMTCIGDLWYPFCNHLHKKQKPQTSIAPLVD